MTPNLSAASPPVMPRSAANYLVGEALRQGAGKLAEAGVEDATLEAEVLLRHVLNVDRTHLYLALEAPLPAAQREAFDGFMERRLRREPLAYVTGRREFYGIDLNVDRRVLIPRPETELLVDCALHWGRRLLGAGNQACRIVDVGTGSGAIAIALALSLPAANICAFDISAAALDVASLNCRRHGVNDRVSLIVGDLLASLAGPVDLIVANLPYIRSCDMPGLAPEIRRFEPSLALDGGEDGLAEIGRLLSSARRCLRNGGAMLLEIGMGQSEKAAHMAGIAFPNTDVSLVPDLAGIDRVLRIETLEL